MLEDDVPGLHMVQPDLGVDPAQKARREIQHRRGSVEHQGYGIDELLALWVNDILQESQAGTVQDIAHRWAKGQKEKMNPCCTETPHTLSSWGWESNG